MAEPQVVVADPAPAIEAESDEHIHDSGIDAESLMLSTTSIGTSVLKYREENGRTYHAYKDGSYVFPNDEQESDRLDLQHHEFMITFENKLFTAPIAKDKILHRVLDVGTGTGIWAIDFADEHPESTVLGVDLSPIQPWFLPPNLSFEIDDIEAAWTFKNKFDFIYSRMMIGSLADVPKFFDQALANLTPGGWLEMADIAYPVKLNDGAFPKDSAHVKWSTLCEEGFQKIGRDASCARYYKDQMIAAGFTNVTETKYMWPTNTWPKDKKLKEIGMWQLENLTSGMEAISVGIFTRVLGWEKDEFDAFLLKVKAELRDTKVHSYYDVFVVTGQAPE